MVITSKGQSGGEIQLHDAVSGIYKTIGVHTGHLLTHNYGLLFTMNLFLDLFFPALVDFYAEYGDGDKPGKGSQVQQVIAEHQRAFEKRQLAVQREELA